MDKIDVMLDKGAFTPVRANPEDAGLDLKARENATIPAKGSCKFNTGVHVNIPNGYVGFLMAKSGLNVNNHIVGTGTIDAGYTGSIVVKLYNLGTEDYCVGAGDKIIQLVILPIVTPVVCVVDNFSSAGITSSRGENGFGSSGR